MAFLFGLILCCLHLASVVKALNNISIPIYLEGAQKVILIGSAHSVQESLVKFVNEHDLEYNTFSHSICSLLKTYQNVPQCDESFISNVPESQRVNSILFIYRSNSQGRQLIESTSQLDSLDGEHVYKVVCLQSPTGSAINLHGGEISSLSSRHWHLSSSSYYNSLCGLENALGASANAFAYLDSYASSHSVGISISLLNRLASRTYAYILPDFTVICTPKDTDICMSGKGRTRNVFTGGSKCDSSITLPSCDPNGLILMSRETAQVLNENMRELDTFNTKFRRERYSDQLAANIAMLGLKVTITILDVQTLNDLIPGPSIGASTGTPPMFSGSSVAVHRNVDMITKAATRVPIYDRDMHALFPWSVVPYIPPPSSVYVDKCALQFPLTGSEFVIVDGKLRLDASFFIAPDDYMALKNKTDRTYWVSVAYSGVMSFRIVVPLESYFNNVNFHFRLLVSDDADKFQLGANLVPNSVLHLNMHVFHTPKTMTQAEVENMSLRYVAPVPNTVCDMKVSMRSGLLTAVVPHKTVARAHPQNLALSANPAGISRVELGALLNSFGVSQPVTVEVGVYRGVFASKFIQVLEPQQGGTHGGGSGGTHYLVDPWSEQDDNADLVNSHYVANNTIHSEAMAGVQQYGDRIVAMHGISTEVSGLFPDASVDLVFIDAQHGYYNCMIDILAWWHKVKPGGILSGHDYDCFAGVSGAVDEFARKMGLKVYYTNNVDYVYFDKAAGRHSRLGIFIRNSGESGPHLEQDY